MARQRDVAGKPPVHRRAVATGELRVRSSTLRAIRAGRVEKGDPIATGEVAGLQAMKRTSELVPHCHSIPLTASAVEIRAGRSTVRVTAEAETVGRTGVEMEALVGATVALLTVWDMVKYLEKDARGLYPDTALGPVRVTRKEKRPGKVP
jgi:cyclic pyranopterin monophosphate synthase